MSFTEEEIRPCYLEDGQTVMVTLTNSGYLLYTLNLLKSLQPYGLDQKVLVICMDAPAAVALKERGYRAHSENHQELARFCPWNTKGYDEICYMKLRLIHRLLEMGRHVLLVDGDVVFRQDPRPAWRSWFSVPASPASPSSPPSPLYDVYIQNDSENNQDTSNMCTGYMWIRSTPTTIRAYDCVSEEGKERYRGCAMDNNDQTYFNRYVKPLCRMYALPLEDYPNGNVYLKRRQELDGRCILVHFNWLKGHHKLVAMKQNRMWLLSPEEERH